MLLKKSVFINVTLIGLASISTTKVLACNSIVLTNGDETYFAKSQEAGNVTPYAIVNKKGVFKTAFMRDDWNEENPMKWVSRYGSVSLTAIAQDMPFGGMNEEGLAIEHLGNQAANIWSTTSDSKSALNEWQWMQYLLDTCKTVDEAIIAHHNLRIRPFGFNIHYILADATGNAAIIEYLNQGELYIYVLNNNDMPENMTVLCNKDYRRSTNYMQNFVPWGGSRSMPALSSNGALDRFAISCFYVYNYNNTPDPKPDAVEYCYGYLDDLSRQRGGQIYGQIYEPHNKLIHYRLTKSPSNRKTIDFSQIDFSTNSADTTQWIALADDVTNPGSWFDYNETVARKVLTDFAAMVSGIPPYTAFNGIVEDIVTYPSSFVFDYLSKPPVTKWIMPLGDSITAGEHYGYPAFGERTGYRKPLYELLAANAYDVDFVGSLNWGFDIVPSFDCDHEGHPGWTAGQIASNVYGWLEQNPPDIILAHVGTNGLSVDNDEDVERMLDEIDRYERDNNVEITLFLARIIHRYEMDSNEITTAFNDAVEAMALSRVQNQGDKIIMVDMENGANIDYMTDGLDMLGTTYPGVSYDRYHPSNQGNIKMAELWFEHLENFLSPPYRAHHPYPENGSYLWPKDFTGFRWSIPAPRHSNDVVTCNVYIGTNPNALGLIAADEPNDFLPSNDYTIIPDTPYYWRVDCNDPNAGHPVITEGKVWTFHTFDPVPNVYAGKDQTGYLSPRSGALIVQMDATVIDEGDPNAVLYYLWSVESAPADTPDVVFDDNTIEDPIVTFSAAGEYILRLSASDDGPVESQDSKDIVSDTVTITVDPPANPRP